MVQPKTHSKSGRSAESGCLEAALSYAALGWSVIAVAPRSKTPLVPWLEYQHRAAEPETIEGWYDRWPDANVGVVTGAISGLVVIDVDPKHGGEESLDELRASHGPLPFTPEVRTGGGGRHLYFFHPGGAVRNRVGFAPGLDVRGDGGVIVAPPSVHPSGHLYQWVGAFPKLSDLAAIPRWLLSLSRSQDAPRGHPAEYWRTLVHEGVPEGQRNNTIASLAGHLLWHGVDPDVVAELLHSWNRIRCKPPLSDDEVLRTVNSIASMHAREEADGETA